MEAMMPNLTIRDCRVEEVDAVLELWRQADATASVTDTADDLRRAVADSPAHVLSPRPMGRSSARSSGRSTAGEATSTGWSFTLATEGEGSPEGWWPKSRSGWPSRE